MLKLITVVKTKIRDFFISFGKNGQRADSISFYSYYPCATCCNGDIVKLIWLLPGELRCLLITRFIWTFPWVDSYSFIQNRKLLLWLTFIFRKCIFDKWKNVMWKAKATILASSFAISLKVSIYGIYVTKDQHVWNVYWSLTFPHCYNK